MIDDDRVRCWDCQHWIVGRIAVPVRQVDGRMEAEMTRRRVCAHDLGYDPLILRRCSTHKRKRPQHIMPIPNTYRQGWRKQICGSK